MESVIRFVEGKLKLKVNREKSAGLGIKIFSSIYIAMVVALNSTDMPHFETSIGDV